jgi:four helix bundle protein
MCRAASSCPANIAEGSNKISKKERFRFYETASCSLEELHYHVLLSKDLRYIDESLYNEIDDHIRRTSYLLGKLQSSIHVCPF